MAENVRGVPPEPLLSVEHLRVAFDGSQVAVDDVSFVLKRTDDPLLVDLYFFERRHSSTTPSRPVVIV